MTKKDYDWENGAQLKDHTAQKLKVLRECFEIQRAARSISRYKKGIASRNAVSISELYAQA